VIPVFPEGSLVSSVVTTTWIGVFVLAFFNLRFGWVLSGIVVPGFLVPLLLVKPWAAVVITAEAVVTYWLVIGLSDQLARWGLWNNFFGRDRFFAIILASIGVRVGFDAWLLPGLGAWLNDTFGLSFDYRNQLHSVGLVIVALMANQFWKPGLIRSVIPTVVTVGLTYVIVRYGLLEVTNFRMADLSVMYEELGSSILASPKAYIVLIVTAFLASRMNLVYGWEFNGILIPSLIALQWWQPLKVLTSFVEAFAIYGLAVLLLRLPVFANTTIEGARKLLFFFNIAFAYKMALGWGLALYAPSVKATDYFAFGYLLSTLIAIKMHDKEIIARLTRATVQTSLTGVAVASILGFGLTLLPAMDPRNGESAAAAPALEAGPSLPAFVGEASVRAYGAGLDGPVKPPTTAEVGRLEAAAEALLAAGRGAPDASWEQAARRFAPLGYRLQRLGADHVAAIDAEPGRGWSSLVVRNGEAADLVVEVPDPLARPQLGAAGAAFAQAVNARVLVLAGSSRSGRVDPGFDPLADFQGAFHAFHRAVAVANVVQLRGGEGPEARLTVKSSLPQGLSARRLEAVLPELSVRFGTGEGTNIQRQSMRTGFAELAIGPSAIAGLVSGGDPDGPPALALTGLPAVFDTGPGLVPPAGSGGYRPPDTADLLYLDREVMTPLLLAARAGYGRDGWAPTAREALARVSSAAVPLGYDLKQLTTPEGPVLVLAQAGEGDRGWGTLVLRPGPAESLGVQVPRPLAEPGTLAAGIDLFRRTRARALLVSGVHPEAVAGGRADILSRRHAANAFNLASQILYRESGQSRFTAAQLRGFAPRPAANPAEAPSVVLAAADGATGRDALPRAGRAVHDALAHGNRVAFADGGLALAGLDVGLTPQAGYLDQAANDSFLTVWVSRAAREPYRDKEGDALEVAHFVALDMATREGPVVAGLGGTPLAPAPPDGLVRDVRDYIDSRDIMALARLQQAWGGYRFERWLDPGSRQSFLLAWRGDRLALMAGLTGGGLAAPLRAGRGHLRGDLLQRLLAARGGLLLAGGE
jgi:hypothetical protein